MGVHALRWDESVVVNGDGRVRVVAWSRGGGGGGGEGDGEKDGGRVPKFRDDDDGAADDGARLVRGYAPRYELPARGERGGDALTLVCRGHVDGLAWEDVHRALADAMSSSSSSSSSLASALASTPNAGGAFFMLARDDATGVVAARTDALGREPLMTRRFGDDDDDDDDGWILANAPGGDWPSSSRDGWSSHHPRHVARVERGGRGGNALSLAPTAAVDDGGDLIPLLPPPLEPPPRFAVAVADETAASGSDPDDAGMAAAAARLASGLLAAVADAAERSRVTAEHPMGVLYSGGVDSTALLACCVRLRVPVVACVACWAPTGGTAEASDVAPARIGAAALGVKLIEREVRSIADVIAALRALTPAVTCLDVVKGAFYVTLVPIRPRRRGERRSSRTFPGVSLRPPLAFNPRPRRLSTPSDAFELHPDMRSYKTTQSRRRVDDVLRVRRRAKRELRGRPRRRRQ